MGFQSEVRVEMVYPLLCSQEVVSLHPRGSPSLGCIPGKAVFCGHG